MIMLRLAVVLLLVLVEGRASLPTTSESPNVDPPTTFQTAQLLIAPDKSVRILNTSSEDLSEISNISLGPSSPENFLVEETTITLPKEEITRANNESIYPPTEESDLNTPTEYIVESMLTEIESTTIPLSETTTVVEEEEEVTTLNPQEEPSTTRDMMIYPETTSIPESSSSKITTTKNQELLYPSSKNDGENKMNTTPTDPLLYSYQNDPHWDLSMDFSDYEAEKEKEDSSKAKSKLNDIQLMDEEGVKDAMKIVLTPINYVRDTMVHIKYKLISEDPTLDGKLLRESDKSSSSDMIPGVSFPLLNQENTKILGDMPEGWYLVCAEVTKFNKMLEEECFTTRIFKKASGGLETGIIVLIVLAMVITALLAVFVVYSKLQSSRRKKKDKEMQDRIEKMAQKEREMNERSKPAFHHIYVDPDEPYEERCIM